MSERITNNVNPTHDDVREWGYDEALYFMEQDEDLLLYGLYYVPILLELAQDSACPKQQYALSILGQSIRQAALHHRSNDLHTLEQLLNTTSLTGDSAIQDWAGYARRLLAYQRHPFIVDEALAWSMAHDLLLGIGRVGTITLGKTEPDEWYFVLVTSIPEHLSIHKHTGIYTYWYAG